MVCHLNIYTCEWFHSMLFFEVEIVKYKPALAFFYARICLARSLFRFLTLITIFSFVLMLKFALGNTLHHAFSQKILLQGE